MSSKSKTTATKDEATPALVPKLRFPEFRDADAWEPTTIGALGSFYYGKSAPKWSLAEDAPTPCVRYGELYTKFGPVITETFSRTNSDPETLRFSKGGEILVPRVGEKPEDFGKCCSYLPLKGVAIGEMISVFETKQHPLFYTYYFRNLYKQFAKVVEGQNVKNLYYVELEPLAIYRPSIPEQQKIAECLSSVDELMAAQARKVDALKSHKKGLMQQLFPREGETQPRLRFPEFQNAGDWEPKLLGDVVKSFKTGKLDANAMVENGQYRFYTCAKNYYQIDTYAFEGEALLVAGNGAHLGYIHHYIGKFNAYQRTYVLQQFEANVDFLRCLLERYLPARIQFEKKDGNTPYIVLSTLTEMPLVIPRDPDEQQRIATCLSSLDALITAETQKHEALKTHKKGLMQQLFPSPEEVAA